MKTYFIIKIIILFNLIFFNLNFSIFNNIEWQKDNSCNNITLFIQKDKNKKLNYYKAQTIIKDISSEKLIEILLNFNEYKNIFPKTIIFKKINSYNNFFIIYAKIDFSPFKNREYFIKLKYDEFYTENNRKKYVIEWSPATTNEFEYIKNDEVIFVDHIYGRWIIEEQTESKLFISVEYYNNWQINAPKTLLTNVEKKATIDAITNLIEYYKSIY